MERIELKHNTCIHRQTQRVRMEQLKYNNRIHRWTQRVRMELKCTHTFPTSIFELKGFGWSNWNIIITSIVKLNGFEWSWNSNIIIVFIVKLKGFEWSWMSTNSITLSQCEYTSNSDDSPYFQWMESGTLCCTIETVDKFSQWIKSCVPYYFNNECTLTRFKTR